MTEDKDGVRTLAGREVVGAKSALLRFRQPGGENSTCSLAPPLPASPQAPYSSLPPMAKAHPFRCGSFPHKSLAFAGAPSFALLGLRGDPIDCHAHVAAKNGFHLFRACGRELCEAFATALNPGSPADGRDFLRAEGVIPASGAFPGQGLPRRPGHPVPVQRPVQEMLQGQHRLVQQHGQAVANPQSPGPGLGQ